MGHLRSHLSERPPVASVISGCVELDEIRQDWRFEYGYMSGGKDAPYIKCRIGIPEGTGGEWAWREGVDCTPERAFLRAYECWGGNVNLPPLEDPAPALPKPKPQEPQQYGERKTASHISSSMASNDPTETAWGNDVHADVPALMVPNPPTEPEWFSKKCGWWIKSQKKDLHYDKTEITWGEAVRMEMDSPGARDNPMGYVKWCIEQRDFDPNADWFKDDSHRRNCINARKLFIERGKGALIWLQRANEASAEGADETPF